MLLKRFVPPLLTLFVGTLSIGATVGLWMHEQRSEQARLQAIFDFNLRQTATRIEQRVANYGQMLRGVQALFLTSGKVERAAFERYCEVVIAGPDSAGLHGFAYAPAVNAVQMPALLAQQHASGLTSYNVHPPGARELYAPIAFAAPLRAHSKKVLGWDMLSEPRRAAGLLQARDSGSFAMTQRLTLAADADRPEVMGFILFAPLYARGQLIDTPEQRRESATGWVMASFRIGDLMAALYGEESPGLLVRLHDGIEPSAATLIYDSGGYSPSLALNGALPRFEAQEYLAFAGHAWTLQLSSLPEFEARHGQNAGRVILVAGTGLSLLLAALTHQLVTARRRAYGVAQAMMGELRDSEERYRRIVETAGEGIWIVDATQYIAFVNPRIAQWLNTTESDMRGRPLDDFMEPQEAARCRAAFSQAPTGANNTMELRLRRRDGGWIWVSLSFRPIVDDAGRSRGALGMLTDISERRLADERRAALEIQLRESQKMEAVGTLAGGIAHDFNNILAAIIGNVAAAREEAAAGRAAGSSLAQIERAAVRARSLVQQILTFSRMHVQVLQTQALQPLVEETLEMMRAAMSSRVELAERMPVEPVFVRADATQIQQIMMNLCTNAWHAMPAGSGRIEVGLDVLAAAVHDVVAPAPAASALPEGPLAHLWVSDNGSGMDEATRARIFEPFFTTKQVGQGTGLGLAVVHGIVSAHGGAIHVASTLGVGSRFDLYFPLQQVPALMPVETSASPSAPRGRGEHVLYVDDDPAMVLMTEELLRRAGYQVSAFESPVEALAAARMNIAAYDIVVTDYNMPDISGMQLAASLGELAPELPVIITSGFISDEMRASAQALGIAALLQKEYTLERLPGIIHAVLDQWGGEGGGTFPVSTGDTQG